MARVREALRKEVAKARAVRLREQAEELRKKAEDMTRTPAKRAEAATLAKKRDQQASLFDDDDLDPPPPGADADLPRNVPPHRPDGTPKPKAQRNFTDPDSRIMVRDGAFLQGYNAQLAVDEGHQIIVAAAVSNQGPDAEYFEPMLRRVVQDCDAVPEKVTADSGYFSAAAVRLAEHIGTEPFISVGKHRNDGSPTDELPLPHYQTAARVKMRALLDTQRGRQAYARRRPPSSRSSARSELHADSGSSRFEASSRTDANGCPPRGGAAPSASCAVFRRPCELRVPRSRSRCRAESADHLATLTCKNIAAVCTIVRDVRCWPAVLDSENIGDYCLREH
jgi:hypothetical protein